MALRSGQKLLHYEIAEQIGEDHRVTGGARRIGLRLDLTGRALGYLLIRSLPDGERRWRISSAGGHQPRWNPSGEELFFLTPDRRMMSVRVHGGSSDFRWDAPAEGHEPRRGDPRLALEPVASERPSRL